MSNITGNLNTEINNGEEKVENNRVVELSKMTKNKLVSLLVQLEMERDNLLAENARLSDMLETAGEAVDEDNNELEQLKEENQQLKQRVAELRGAKLRPLRTAEETRKAFFEAMDISPTNECWNQLDISSIDSWYNLHVPKEVYLQAQGFWHKFMGQVARRATEKTHKAKFFNGNLRIHRRPNTHQEPDETSK